VETNVPIFICMVRIPLSDSIIKSAHEPLERRHSHAALVGAYVALAVLLIVAVLRVVRPRPDGHR